MENNENKNQEQVITPSQYFDYLKGAKQTITSEALKNSYETFIKLGEKYKKLGQTESIKKLCFLADTMLKEEKLIEMGITTYIYKDTIEDYIEHVADKTVKIVELSRYMREIPDELVDVIEKTRTLFDQFYVVFTDYTGKEERKVKKERQDKDPILFGVFKTNTTISDRFYFIGDWVDEYCDLTLDKMVEQYEAAKGYSPTVVTSIPTTTEELIDVLKTLKPVEGTKTQEFIIDGLDMGTTGTVSLNSITVPDFKVDKKMGEPKKSLFDKVRSIFSKNDR